MCKILSLSPLYSIACAVGCEISRLVVAGHVLTICPASLYFPKIKVRCSVDETSVNTVTTRLRDPPDASPAYPHHVSCQVWKANNQGPLPSHVMSLSPRSDIHTSSFPPSCFVVDREHINSKFGSLKIYHQTRSHTPEGTWSVMCGRQTA